MRTSPSHGHNSTNAAEMLELRRRSRSRPIGIGNWAIRRTVSRLRYVRLKGHTGCVNSVAWSSDGETLASVSDDQHLRFWNVSALQRKDVSVATVRTSHTNNILSCTFLGKTNRVATLGWDRRVIVHDVQTGTAIGWLRSPNGNETVSDDIFPRHLCRVVCHVESANVFYFGGSDRVVYRADTRARSAHVFSQAEFESSTRGAGTLMNALCFRRPHELFASGMTRGFIYLYDARKMTASSPVQRFRTTDRESTTVTITSLDVSKYGTELLANVSLDFRNSELQVFKLDRTRGRHCSPTRFRGHNNSQTMNAEAKFVGPRDQYIVAGSDSGSLVFWERGSRFSRCVMRKPCDRSISNVVAPRRGRDEENVTIASGGISSDVKLWTASMSPDRTPRHECSSSSSSSENEYDWMNDAEQTDSFSSDSDEVVSIDAGSFFLPRS